DQQHRLSPNPVAEWPEDEAAERTHHERGRQCAEGGDEVAGARLTVRIKRLCQGRGDQAVQAEVVGLHEVADGRARDRATCRAAFDGLHVHRHGRIPATPGAYTNWCSTTPWGSRSVPVAARVDGLGGPETA